MMRITLIALLCLAFVAFTVVDAQIATQSCAETNGTRPCICNDSPDTNGCNCRYPGNCASRSFIENRAAITCRSQCGNGALNENEPGSTYQITRNPATCPDFVGCDLLVTGETNSHTCTETCDTGLNVGKFVDGTCCTRECNSTRTTDEFHYWNIVPRQCTTKADCLDAGPGYNIDCVPLGLEGWCRYRPGNALPTIRTGVRPGGEGSQWCPKFPCFDTANGFGFCRTSGKHYKNNILTLTTDSSKNKNWYHTEAYYASCYQESSNCWAEPKCSAGTLYATPKATSVTITPRASATISCAAPVPIANVANIVSATVPATLGYSFVYVSDTCPGTVAQVGTNLVFSGISGTGTCTITTNVRSECNKYYSSAPVTVQYSC